MKNTKRLTAFILTLIFFTQLTPFTVIAALSAEAVSYDSTPVSLPNNADLANVRNPLPFSVTDAVSTPDGSALFISVKSENKVYRIDTETYETQSVTFKGYMPESLAFADGKLYVALCTREHSYDWFDEDGHTGAFAIIKADGFSLEAIRDIAADPYDIAVTKNGYICISSGSGQWTYFTVYKKDGTLVGNSSIRHMSKIIYNALLNKIYSVTTDTSPRDINAYRLNAGGNVAENYDSPYHGDYSMGTTLHVSPDGQYIFTNSGNVFTSSNVREKDMIYKTMLAKSYSDLVFSADGTKFYTALDDSKLIYSYAYPSFDGIETFETQGYVQYLFLHNNKLIAISKETLNGNTYFIENINLSAPKQNLETTITRKNLSVEYGCVALSAKNLDKTIFERNMVYILDSAANSVYATNIMTLVETKITFAYAPNSLFYRNGELFVGFGNSGRVAILDTATFTVKKSFLLSNNFSDMALGDDGYLYVLGFGQTFVFSTTTLQMISATSTNYSGKLVPSPVSNAFYYTYTNVSPQDINTIKYNNGVITAAYDSPYHGNYSIGSDIHISPDGKYIFTSDGSVFTSSGVREKDMIYKDSFTNFFDLAFYLPMRVMVASKNDENLYVYDYDTYEILGYIWTVAPVKKIEVSGNNIIAISSANNTNYLEVFSMTVYGDVNGDGQLDVGDLVSLAKHIAEIDFLTGVYLDAADINLDGKVNVADLILLSQMLVTD